MQTFSFISSIDHWGFFVVKTILSEISQTNTQHADSVFSWALQCNIYPFTGEEPNWAQTNGSLQPNTAFEKQPQLCWQCCRQQSIQEHFMQSQHHDKWHKWDRDYSFLVPSHPQMSWAALVSYCAAPEAEGAALFHRRELPAAFPSFLMVLLWKLSSGFYSLIRYKL